MTGPALTPLLIRYGRVGDMVMQAPLLHLLHRRYGRPCSLLSRGKWSSALYSGSGDVESIRQLRGRHTPFILSPQRWLLVRELQRHQGPIYISEDIPRQTQKIRELLARACVPEERCLFYLDCPQISSTHWVDRLLDFGCLTPPAFSASDYPWSESDLHRAPQLAISTQDRVDRDSWLQRRGFADRQLVLVQPGNKRTSRRKSSRQTDSKTWPVECWGALLRAMRRRLPEAQLVLCGSPPEASLLEAVRQSSGIERIGIAARDMPLRRLLAVAEIAHSMVTVDTGPAHLAAAAGCPLVVLYGAESPARWDRRSPFARPVINLGGPPQTTRVDELPLDEIVAAWLRLADAEGVEGQGRVASAACAA